ncbi:MAG: hypothetical protein ABL857_02815 [Rickettsiales bacterium]|jgi:hypothetical protein
MLKTTIPFIDLRGKTPTDLLRSYPDSARALVMAARRSYGVLSHVASGLVLPFIDKKSHAWLTRTRNPYLHEIETFDSILGMRGTFSLNLSYEWGCTSGAYRNEESIGMMRVLDWPFPKLGSHVLVVLQNSKVGDFYNVTWPGISGVFNAMAPMRFCGALNLAPMRRHGLGFALDWVKNRKIATKQMGLPPAHLLRQVFEQAENYTIAKEMLMNTPLAVPAIFTLTGLNEGEGCIIERLENSAEVREIGADRQVAASNQFQTSLTKGMKARPFFNSNGRWQQGCSLQGHEIMQGDFSWLCAPILNPFTRLCMVADAATGDMKVQGFDGVVAVTELFNLPKRT